MEYADIVQWQNGRFVIVRLSVRVRLSALLSISTILSLGQSGWRMNGDELRTRSELVCNISLLD